MAKEEIFLYQTGVSILTLALYIVFLVGIPYIIAFALRSILVLKKVNNKKIDKVFWIVFISLLALWNGLIFFIELFR